MRFSKTKKTPLYYFDRFLRLFGYLIWVEVDLKTKKIVKIKVVKNYEC